MTQKRDLRVQKTYSALFRAFQDLLREKSFDDITVTELCDRALIRTATFYKHFPDKYAFASFMLCELRQAYYKAALQTPHASEEDFYLNLVRASFTFLQEHQTLVRSLNADSMMSTIALTSSDSLRSELIFHLTKNQQSGQDLAASPALTAEIFIGSVNQVGRWWLSHPNELSLPTLVEQLRPFVRRLLNG